MKWPSGDDEGKDQEALKQYALLIEGRTVLNRALERWVQLMMKFERTEEAIPWLEKRVHVNSANVFLKILLAGCYVQLGIFEKAVGNLNAAFELDPENIRVLHDLGVTMRFTGRIEESKAWFERVLVKDPNHAGALRVFGTEHRYEYGDHAFNRLMHAAAHAAEYTEPGRVQLHYALGKCFDDVGDYATAFEHFAVGGKLHLSRHPQGGSQIEKYQRFVKENLTREFFEGFGKKGAETSKPLFVLGMPRSGTSLVEQVLASHPDVFGAGELKLVTRIIDGMQVAGKIKLELKHRAPLFPMNTNVDYSGRGEKYLQMVEELEKNDCKRIVDKMPGNYMWAGLIHMILPNAPIVHTRRHPIETCLSAYRIYFPDGQYWSFDLKEMGKAYRQYLDLMQHWRESLPAGRILDVRYEDMVNDFEAQARRLVAYCGLDWRDACLNFHETDRAVRTASASQVRKPVYKTSMGRWRKYEAYLKPLLEELGPVVQQYEEELAQTYPS